MGALLFSLSIHAFFGYSLWAVTYRNTVSSPEPIQISEVLYERPLLREKTAELSRAVTPKVEEKYLQPKKPPLKSVALPEIQDFSSKHPAVQPAQAVSKPLPQRPKTAVDFMADPQKGRIFVNYFGKLKEKIYTTIRRKYNSVDGSLGVVSLFFILNPDGSLVRTSLVEKESDAPPLLQKIALDSLRRSAPFGGFPRDLGNVPVAFSLKIYFNELDHD